MKKMTFKTFKFYLILFLFSTLLLSSIPTKSVKESTFSVTRIDTQYTKDSIKVVKYSDMWEQAWVWADHSGQINSRVDVQSKDLGFGDQSLNLFITSYSNIYSLFDHANWWFNPTDNPMDRNANMELQFRTTDASLAKQYADLFAEFVNGELGINFEYEGTETWDDWREHENKWVQLTRVRYSTHIDFPWFTDYINNSIIPRDIGGLAETIDVTESNHISAWAWPQGDVSNPEIGFSFGFDFNKHIYDISSSFSGSHTLPINDLIHVDKIQKSPYQGELWINYDLPNVSSLTHIPLTNDTNNIEIFTDYHPPSEEWIKHNYWNVNFRIKAGTYTDISVSFNYDFIPWFLETRVTSDLIVNSYGYLFKGISLQGEYTSLIDLESLQDWDLNIALVEISFYPTMEFLWDSFQVRIGYPDYDDHFAYAYNLSSAIANFFGITYKNNWNDSWSWGPNFNGISYNFNSDDFNVTMSENLLIGHNVTQSTPAFNGQNITAITEYRQTTFYRSAIDGYINQMEFKWNPLSYEIQYPDKDYPGYQSDVNIDLLTEWGWSTYPFSSNYSRSEFRIVYPVENDNFNVYPNENNGWGWDIGTWNENWDNINYITHNLNIYTDSTSLKFENKTAFGNFGGYIEYHFHADSEDISSPGMHINYQADNGTVYDDEWQISSFTFSGLDEHLKVQSWDDNSYGIHSWWWNFYFRNQTSEQDEPRFGLSGVKQVSARAYFADLPVRSDQFEKEVTMVKTSENERSANYNVSWNTTDGFADGEWTLLFDVEDNSGNNQEGWAFHSLMVDNYDDAVYIEGPKINVLSAVNTTVNGTHAVQVNVTDDVGLFAVVLTRDGAVWLLNDSNSDDIYEFNWYTMGEMEGSSHFFTITAWDMDGHKTIYGYQLEVDNIPVGEAPTIEFMSPNSENETLSGMYTFEVHVIEDHGISSVKMQIDEGASYPMVFNELSYYELTYNLSSLVNGYRELIVTVIDIDENQHTVTESIHFTVTGGLEGPDPASNAPEWDRSLSNLPKNLSEFVDQGNYLEYNAEVGELFFEVAVKDDTGIAVVYFTIYIIEDFSSLTGEPDLSGANQLLSSPLTSTGTSNDWEFYEYTWTSSSASDNYYVCEFDVQDIDTVANHLYIRVSLETDNFEDDQPTLAGVPGFELGVLMIGLTICSLVATIRNRKRIKKK